MEKRFIFNITFEIPCWPVPGLFRKKLFVEIGKSYTILLYLSCFGFSDLIFNPFMSGGFILCSRWASLGKNLLFLKMKGLRKMIFIPFALRKMTWKKYWKKEAEKKIQDKKMLK